MIVSPGREFLAPGVIRGRWGHGREDGRVQCDLCPRACRLHEGHGMPIPAKPLRGFCCVRRWDLGPDGHYRACGARRPGRFAGGPGAWGPRRLPLAIHA